MLIVDGSNLVFRNFHVFEHLSNRHGYLTGAIYGFFNSLLPYVSRTSSFIVTWEGGNNWRNEIYPEYKGNRKEKEPVKIQALKDVQELCTLCGMVQIRKPGFEADDAIAHLVKKFKTNLRILSGDKDLLQLIDDENNVAVFRPNPKHGIIEYNEKVTEELMGIPKKYISLYLAILGDDNIEGVKGWGKVRATKIINGSEDPLEYIQSLYPTQYEIIQRNLKLIDLKNPMKEIESLTSDELITKLPNLFELNKKLFEYEINAYSSKTLIESFFNLEFQNQAKSILITAK